jgi:hypothetical protein
MVGNLVKLLALAAVLLLVGTAVFRPATLFGVDSTALANSVSGELEHSHAKCQSDGSGFWRCRVDGGNQSGAEYAVTTHRFGCWTGTRLGRTKPGQAVRHSVSGCIGLTDMFGH